MKSSLKIIILLSITLLLFPQISKASECETLYGVKIYLNNNKVLNGYFLSNSKLNSCNKSEDSILEWNSYLGNNQDGNSITFIGRLIKLETVPEPNIIVAKSSVKEIKIDDIKRIEGVCRKWSGTIIYFLSRDSRFKAISDSLFEYISNHKVVAFYSFTEGPTRDDPGYYFTHIISYNTDYPRKRLIKERKIINKMSSDKLSKEKLITINWSDV